MLDLLGFLSIVMVSLFGEFGFDHEFTMNRFDGLINTLYLRWFSSFCICFSL